MGTQTMEGFQVIYFLLHNKNLNKTKAYLLSIVFFSFIDQNVFEMTKKN